MESGGDWPIVPLGTVACGCGRVVMAVVGGVGFGFDERGVEGVVGGDILRGSLWGGDSEEGEGGEWWGVRYTDE